MPPLPKPVIPALLRSGFPFQTAIAAAIRQAPGWTLYGEEFPWQDDAGEAHFLDLVARTDSLVVGIECKKTSEQHLIFLRPPPSDNDVKAARTLFIQPNWGTTPGRYLVCGWWLFEPVSYESTYCVVSAGNSKDRRLLEKEASLLARGVEAFAMFERLYASQHNPYLPVLVTNASLFVARYEPSKVSLDSGELEPRPRPDSITPVSWVRFTKPFTSGGGDRGVRTVFVVRARAFVDFLAALRFLGQGPAQRGMARIFPHS